MVLHAPRPQVVVIAAIATQNRLIGRQCGLPWPPIHEDLRRFKQLTLGHALIVGRSTFESIILQFGRPLPRRRMMVLTTRGSLPGHPDIETFPSLPAALHAAQGEKRVFVAGGTRPYREALELADRLELTLVEGAYEGDTYFPPYAQLIETRYELANKVTRSGYSFQTYQHCSSVPPAAG